MGDSEPCCKCLSPFSFAGLLSEPLLLPDCSFSFSKAVAYANVSCGRFKHEKKMLGTMQWQQHCQGRLPFYLTFGGWCPHGSPQSTPQPIWHTGARLTNAHRFSSWQIICKLYTNLVSCHRNSIISSALSHFQPITLFSEAAVSEKH